MQQLVYNSQGHLRIFFVLGHLKTLLDNYELFKHAALVQYSTVLYISDLKKLVDNNLKLWAKTMT